MTDMVNNLPHYRDASRIECIEVTKQGRKDDTKKRRYSLLPTGTVNQVVDVLEFGAEKYSSNAIIDTNEFSEIIKVELCRKLQIASSVVRLKALFQEGCAQPAIEMTQLDMQSAKSAKTLDTLLLNMDYAVAAMSERDLVKEARSQLERLSIKNNIAQPPNSEQKRKYEKKIDEKTLNILKQLSAMDSYGILQSMASQSNSITIYLKEVALSVVAKSAHTLTTTIKLENLEICCVVSATKHLDCYKMTLLLLKILLGISVSTKILEKHISGVNNWQKVPDARRRYYDAAMRHIDSWFGGEVKDSETGLPHLAHAVCCLLFLIWFDSEASGSNY